MNSDHIIKQFEPLWGVWNVDKKLGEGTYGSVYQVSRKDWDKSYEAAVKVISIPSSSNEIKEAYSNGADDNSISTYFEEAVKNMIKEIEFMYKFKGNSYIVSYEDHWIHTKYNEPGWHIFIRMELLQPLSDYFKGRQVTELAITRIGIQICHALESCLKKGVIHRDIKDANIFVTKEGNFKLGDFGIARELSKTGKAATMKGTPNYMAPEVYKGLEYNHTADIYSLGLVLYKLANHNRYPFSPDYPNQISSVDIDKALITRLSGNALRLPLMCSEVLGQIIVKACEFDPSNRYASPKEFRMALESYEKQLESEGIVSQEEEVVFNQGSEIVDIDSPNYKSNESTISVASGGDHTVSIHENSGSITGSANNDDKKGSEISGLTTEIENQDDKDDKDKVIEIIPDLPKNKRNKGVKIASVSALLFVLIGGVVFANYMKNAQNDSDNLVLSETVEVSEETTEETTEVTSEEEATEEKVTWSFNQPQVKLEKGENFKIEIIPSAEVAEAKYQWTWISRDEKVATVDAEGNITAVGAGRTVMSAALTGANDVYNIDVEVTEKIVEVTTEAPTQPTTEKTTQPKPQPTTEKTTQPKPQPTTEKATEAPAVPKGVTFSDPTFEAVVRKAAGKTSGTLTVDDLSKIYTLDASSKGITSINGIQNIKNLKQLNLSNNNLTDISKLSSLTKLTYLNLKGNSFTSISALKNLTQLKKLYLKGNPISDYSPVNGYFSQLEDQDFK